MATPKTKWPLMSAAEFHRFGIECVLKALPDERFEIESVNYDLGADIQVIGKRWGIPSFVIVRTEMLPDEATMGNEEATFAICLSRELGRLSFVALQSLWCFAYPDGTPVDDEREGGLPIRHGGYWSTYKGLQQIVDANQVTLLDHGRGQVFRG